MLIKVDLDKAYNRFSWDFIYQTLREVGSELTRITMDCISSATICRFCGIVTALIIFPHLEA